MTSEASPDKTSVQTCPLSVRQQNWNLVRYAVHTSLLYLAAPVAYVGEVDAILLNKLGYCDKVANLPAAAFMWTTAPFLVLFTWYFCYVRMLKPVVVASYAVTAASGLIVVVSLLQPHSNWLVVALIVHATLMGWCLGVAGLFEWEILARGVTEQRRGLALGLAFGFGPLMAVLSSLGTQLVLDGKLGPIDTGKLAFPWDFHLLFVASVLIMAVPALSATRYFVPIPPVEIIREPLISGVFGGFGDFLRDRLLLLTSIAFLLVSRQRGDSAQRGSLYEGGDRRRTTEVCRLSVCASVRFQSRGGVAAGMDVGANLSPSRANGHNVPLLGRLGMGPAGVRKMVPDESGYPGRRRTVRRLLSELHHLVLADVAASAAIWPTQTCWRCR